MNTILVTVVLAMICAFTPSSRTADRASAAQMPETGSSTKHESPFMCDRLALTPELRKRHFDDLGPKLLALKTGVRELPDGYEFSFPSDTIQLVAEWAIQERLCCPFFDISLRFEREGGPIWMRFTGRKGTKDFIKADGAQWIKQ
jgi:hypothetical protein